MSLVCCQNDTFPSPKSTLAAKIPGLHGSHFTSVLHDQVMTVAWTSATLMLPIFSRASLAQRIRSSWVTARRYLIPGVFLRVSGPSNEVVNATPDPPARIHQQIEQRPSARSFRSFRDAAAFKGLTLARFQPHEPLRVGRQQYPFDSLPWEGKTCGTGASCRRLLSSGLVV